MHYTLPQGKLMKLESKQDSSVNFIEENLKGFIESRYVVNAMAIADALNDFHITYEVNLVRYNPFSKEQGEEASEESYQGVKDFFTHIARKSKIIKRVGFDAHCSCGTFYK